MNRCAQLTDAQCKYAFEVIGEALESFEGLLMAFDGARLLSVVLLLIQWPKIFDIRTMV